MEKRFAVRIAMYLDDEVNDVELFTLHMNSTSKEQVRLEVNNEYRWNPLFAGIYDIKEV